MPVCNLCVYISVEVCYLDRDEYKTKQNANGNNGYIFYWCKTLLGVAKCCKEFMDNYIFIQHDKFTPVTCHNKLINKYLHVMICCINKINK